MVFRVSLLAAIVTFSLIAPVGADNVVEITKKNPESGKFGAQTRYDGSATKSFLLDKSPTAESRYIAVWNFYLDTISRNFSIESGDRHEILAALENGGRKIVRVFLGRNGKGTYYCMLRVKHDTGSVSVGRVSLKTDRWQRITIDWQASSGPGIDDGFASIRKNNAVPKLVTNLDNDEHLIDRQELGAVSGVDPKTRGIVYFDNFISRRSP